MPYFVRKIARAKWSNESITDNPFDIPADAITLDLKTFTNTLSVWEVTDEGKVGDAVLAIASGFDRIETFDGLSRDELRFCRAAPGRACAGLRAPRRIF